MLFWKSAEMKHVVSKSKYCLNSILFLSDVAGLEKEKHYTLPKLRSEDGCSSPIKEKCLENEQ